MGQVNKFRKEFRKSRRSIWYFCPTTRSIVIPLMVLTSVLVASNQMEALRITHFHVPAYVPITPPQTSAGLELAKPLVLDCDYDYEPDQDARLTVRWFRDKEAEPFYQWLPELGVRHFADWIKPLVDQSYQSESAAQDPLRRYRSVALRRLSMNLTGVYSCLVSSLASQESRQASLVVYQPPRTFTFEHRIFPAPALPAPAISSLASSPQSGQRRAEELRPSPTQFKGYSQPAVIVRPPNNNTTHYSSTPAPKLVYTHDGRPVQRKSRQADPIAGWMLAKRLRLAEEERAGGVGAEELGFAVQLHHFQCQATQITPRPVMVLTVKRGADSIAQYLHESSSVSVRPYQVSHAHYYSAPPLGAGESGGEREQLLVTLYDITVSATVALNVSLQPAVAGPASGPEPAAWNGLEPGGVNTVLGFRLGQRMSFECHLEITGTEFEQRKRININQEEVYKLAQADKMKKKLRLLQENKQVPQNAGTSSLRFAPPQLANNHSKGLSCQTWLLMLLLMLPLL